ncbi:MAG: cytochrome c [Pseudomonadota bacterium]
MVRRLLLLVLLVCAVGGAGFWVVSAAETQLPFALPQEPGDPTAGETVFHISGCASCHAEKGAEGDERFKLAGGRAFETPFGTFHAPNVSMDPQTGIGAWTLEDFALAILNGVAPDGSHYYPAFPYASYARMTGKDVADLWAFMRTLPAIERANVAHELGFPFNVRRGLGLWKRLYLSRDQIVEIGSSDEAIARGQYLVEGPGHCGECHTPRSAMGGLDPTRWLAGAPNPDGDGRIPNITPGEGGIGGWSQADIAEYLRSGFTPEFDTAGGSMVDVIRNTSQISDADRQAIATYLKALPAVP